MAHPNVRSRKPGDAGNRMLVYADKPIISQWIEEELADADFTIQIARSAAEVVAALVEDPPPRPQILVADFLSMSATDVLHIHAIRDRGWFGILIALGPISDDLRKSLNVGPVLLPPFERGALGKVVADIGLHRATTRIGKLDS